MIRKIIKIDEKKCNGCGLCVNACHEGSLQLIDGKVRLVSESYCDGLGDCLPECPTGAIAMEENNVEAYDHEAVQSHLHTSKEKTTTASPPSLRLSGYADKKTCRKGSGDSIEPCV